MRIIELLKNSAEADPQRTAIRSGDAEISHEQMCSLVFALSDCLKAVGCRCGVKVAIVLENSAEYLISFFAISAAEGIIVPLSGRMAPHEIAGYINRTDISIVITNQPTWNRVAETLHVSRRITAMYIECEPEGNLELETGALGDCSIDRENSDVALMLPTSGTTGTPKIVMLTDSNLISNMTTYRSLMGFDGHNAVFCALSFHHIYCICAQILTHISRADTFVLNSGPFFAKDFLRTVEAYGITITAFVPYMAILLAEYPDPGSFDIESLRYVTLSGAKTPRATCELLKEKYPNVQFIGTYGMSEAGSRVSLARPSSECFPVESVGRPMPGVAVRIVCEKGNDAPANRPGEILVKSSGVMKGYYRQPELTERIITDGWLRTGDLGKMDEEGNLFILGRTRETIITGGENVCPFEIEECLVKHPAVREAVVVGQRHKLLQEVPFAFVVKNNANEKLTAIDIVEFCRERLSSYKIPKSTRFMEKLPKLSTSKIDRKALKAMADNLE